MSPFDPKTWQIQVRKGLIEYMTMQLLSESEAHGYELVQRMRQLPKFEVTESAIYPILTRYRKENLLTSVSIPSESGPTRTVYRLTPLGRTRLLGMRNFLRDLISAISPNLTKPE